MQKPQAQIGGRSMPNFWPIVLVGIRFADKFAKLADIRPK